MYHEICIAVKQNVFTLLDRLLIDLDDVAEVVKAPGYKKHNQAMLVLLGHNRCTSSSSRRQGHSA